MPDLPAFLLIHRILGGLTVAAGLCAILTTKGRTVHRISGGLFVLGILGLALTVAATTLWLPDRTSRLGQVFAALTAYMALTGWHSARARSARIRLPDRLFPALAALITLFAIAAMHHRFDTPTGLDAANPAAAYIVFAAIALLITITDLTRLRHGPSRGTWRIQRHLFRMSFALYFATSSMFTGPGRSLFPDTLQSSPLLYVPETLVLVAALAGSLRIGLAARRARTAPA